MKKLLVMTTAMIMSAPAMAADGFGDRFGSSTPYALSDSMENSIADTQGFDMDDLNDPAALNRIDPAAGEEDAQAQRDELDAEAQIEASDNEGGAPGTLVEPGDAGSGVETAAENEDSSAEIEPAAGASAESASEADIDQSQPGTETGVTADANADVDVTVPVEE